MYKIVLEDFVHFKEEHSEESTSSNYSNESSENKITEEEKEFLEPTLINNSFKNSNEGRWKIIIFMSRYTML